MDGIIDPFLTGEMTVSRKSWHYRLYQYWQKTGGKNQYGFRENLCHYCRVVALWAPLHWFLYQKLWSLSVLRPWVIALVTMLLSTIGVTAAIWPAEFWHVFGRILIVLGMTIGIMLLIAFIMWAFLWKLNVDDKVKAWFDRHEKTKTILEASPFVFLGVYFLGLLGLGFYFHPLITGIVIGSLIGTVMLLIAVASLWERYRKRAYATPKRPPTAIGEGVKLAWQYLMAKKHKVCPLIRFTD